ncbi:N-acetyltransferase [Carboxydothermus ferrireducens]|uniref:Ribosomal protein S18 acetylase RimI-like enzyme n=1 Tax=Carboxydothermus ferrireducens DSM 11255 TaxID=1119529 RepID=A0ABX2R8B4_9THEO|nr:hypothetical protein [Carboxydothermus ferrireducens]NYE56797.1 ribosomal protein S18 acetylase RimI-like enzyme [Carboxydothermus ferrireducens DSM 11255]
MNNCKKRFPNQTVALEVRSFNQRAINCYKKVGFSIKREYLKNISNEDVKFYYMELEE